MSSSASATHPPPLAPAPPMQALALPPGTHHPSLPSSASNSENGTPVPSVSGADNKKKPTAKRKRTADSMGDSDTAHPRSRDGPKKKKANRACFHCQKAHLTCDDCESCFHPLCRMYARPSLAADSGHPVARMAAGRFLLQRLLSFAGVHDTARVHVQGRPLRSRMLPVPHRAPHPRTIYDGSLRRALGRAQTHAGISE